MHDVVLNHTHARFDVDTQHLDAVVRQLSTLGVRSLTSTPPTLEEMFLRHYGDEEPPAPGDGVTRAAAGRRATAGTTGRGTDHRRPASCCASCCGGNGSGCRGGCSASGFLVLYQSMRSQSLYNTPEELAQLRETLGANAAVVAMSGPKELLDTIGGEVVFEIFAYAGRSSSP